LAITGPKKADPLEPFWSSNGTNKNERGQGGAGIGMAKPVAAKRG
jgi:hypothetical protein